MNTILSIIPKLPPAQQLIPGIIRILGQNPSLWTLQGTNSYLLGIGSSKNSKVLIDTSDSINGNYVRNVLEILRSFGPKTFISDIVLTHWHADHVGAVNLMQDALKSSTGVCANILKYPSNDNHKTIDFSHHNLSNGQSIDVPGLGPLEIIHTPGHTDDHICLYLSKQHIMFTGDLILGAGSTSFEYLNSYMKSLNLIKSMTGTMRFMLPGHGQIITDPLLKVNEYIAHRKERISDVYNLLDRGRWGTERELLHFIYQDVAPQVISGCLVNQRQALIYLEKQKLIESAPLTNPGDFEVTHGLNKKWRRIKNSADSFQIEFE